MAKGGMQQAGHAPESLDSDVLCWAVFSLRDKDWKVWDFYTEQAGGGEGGKELFQSPHSQRPPRPTAAQGP